MLQTGFHNLIVPLLATVHGCCFCVIFYCSKSVLSRYISWPSNVSQRALETISVQETERFKVLRKGWPCSEPGRTLGHCHSRQGEGCVNTVALQDGRRLWLSPHCQTLVKDTMFNSIPTPPPRVSPYPSTTFLTSLPTHQTAHSVWPFLGF